jgi:metal-responsive CopG/Arc/MetJ family transcriptional regulator
MATVKTAISLEEPLLKRADRVARELNVSRSRLFALAVDAFIQQRQNEALLNALNEAYTDAATDEQDETEERYWQKMKAYHFQLTADEAW